MATLGNPSNFSHSNGSPIDYGTTTGVINVAVPVTDKVLVGSYYSRSATVPTLWPGVVIDRVESTVDQGTLVLFHWYRGESTATTLQAKGPDQFNLIVVRYPRLPRDPSLSPFLAIDVQPIINGNGGTVTNPSGLVTQHDSHLVIGHATANAEVWTPSPALVSIDISVANSLRLQLHAPPNSEPMDGRPTTLTATDSTVALTTNGWIFAYTTQSTTNDSRFGYNTTPFVRSVERKTQLAGPITVPAPNDLVPGNLLLAMLVSGLSNPGVVLPAGFTLRQELKNVDVSGVLATKVITSTEPTEYTFSGVDEVAAYVVQVERAVENDIVWAIDIQSGQKQLTTPLTMTSYSKILALGGNPAGLSWFVQNYAAGDTNVVRGTPNSTSTGIRSYLNEEDTANTPIQFEHGHDSTINLVVISVGLNRQGPLPNIEAAATLAADSAMEVPGLRKAEAIFAAKSSLVADYNTVSVGKPRAYPIETVTSGGTWSKAPAAYFLDWDPTGTDQYTDYNCQTTSPPAGVFADAPLSAVSTPKVRTGHAVRIRHGKSASAGKAIDVTIDLRQGSTAIGSWTVPNATLSASTSFVSEFALTEAQANAITDYANLFIRVTPLASGGGAGRDYILYDFDLLVDPPADLWTASSRMDADSTLQVAGNLGQFAGAGMAAESVLQVLTGAVQEAEGGVACAATSSLSVGTVYVGPAPVVSASAALNSTSSLFAHGILEVNPPARVPPVRELAVWNDITSSSSSVVPVNTTVNQDDLLVLPFVTDVTSGSATMANPTVTGTAVLGTWSSQNTVNGNGDAGIRTITFYTKVLQGGTVVDATFTHPVAVEKASKPLVIEGPAYVAGTKGEFGPGAGPLFVSIGPPVGDYDTVLGIVGNRSGTEPTRFEAPLMTSFTLNTNSDTATTANGTKVGIGVGYWDGPNLPSGHPTTFDADFLGVSGQDAVAVQLIAIVYRTPIQAYVHLGADSTLSASATTESTGPQTQQGAVSCVASSSMVVSGGVVGTLTGTALFAGAATMSATAAMSIAGSASLTAGSSLTSGGALAVNSTVALSATSTLGSTANLTTVSAVSLAAAGTMAVTPAVQVQASSTLSSTSTLSVGAAAILSADVALAANSSLAAPSLVAVGGSTTLAAQASLSTNTAVQVLVTASLAGTSSLSSAGNLDISTVIQMSGGSTLSTSAAINVLAASVLAAGSALTATALNSIQAEASLLGTSLMGTSGERGILGEAALGAQSSLAAASNITTAANATLTATSTLSTSGASLAIVEGTAALAASATLSTSAEGQVPASTTLTGATSLSVEGTLTQFAIDTMAANGTLTTTADVLVVAEATLVSTATFGSTGTATVTAGATLGATSSMSVGAGVLSDTNAALSATSSLSTASTVTVASSAALAATATFGSTGSATATGMANLAADSILSGEGTRQALGVVAFTAEASLTSSATSLSSTSATLVASSSLVLGHLVTVEAEATLAGTSSFTTTAERIAVAQASLSGVSNLSGSGARLISGEAVLAESSSLTTVGAVRVLATTTLSAGSTLGTTGLNVVQATVTLSAVGEFLSPVILEISAQVALVADSSLSASGRGTSNIASDMGAVSSLSSAADVLHLGQAALTGTASLLSGGFALTSALAAMVASAFLQAEGGRATTGGAALESGSTLVVFDRVITGGPGVVSLSITARKGADVSLKTVEVV